jgi:tetratricopeptide (TPR) repeat protein
VYDPIHERILIVKLGATGDVLRTTSCLPPLKARYPRSHITWVTRSSSRAGLAGNPAIDRVLTVDGNYLEFLMAEEFDLAIGPDADLLIDGGLAWDLDTAIDYYRQSLDLDPAFGQAYSNLGLAYQKTGRMDQAGNAYREAAKLRPDDGEIRDQLREIESIK